MKLRKINLPLLCVLINDEKSTSLEECKNNLGVGPYGLALLAAGSGAALAKNVVTQIRNPNVVLCPIAYKSATMDSDLKSKMKWLEFLFEEKAWAWCTNQLSIMQRDLYFKLNTNLNLLDKTIQQEEAKIKALKDSSSEAESKVLEEKKQIESEIAKIKEQIDKNNLKAQEFNELQNKRYDDGSFLNDLNKQQNMQGELWRSLQEDYSVKGRENLKSYSELLKLVDCDAQIESVQDISDKLKVILSQSKLSEDFKEKYAQLFLSKVERAYLTQTHRVSGQKLSESLSQKTKALENVSRMQKSPASPAVSSSAGSANTLSFLRKQREELSKIKAGLDPKRALTAKQLAEAAHKIYDSGVFSDEVKAHLNIMGGLLDQAMRKTAYESAKAASAQGLMTSAERHAKEAKTAKEALDSLPANLSLKGFMAKSILKGVATVAGAMGVTAMANASALEKPLSNALDAADPTAFFHSENLGGECGDMVPSHFISRKKEQGCGFDLSFTESVYNLFLSAEDPELEELFKDRGICDFINLNYDRFYPKPTMAAVNCSSANIVVNFKNNSYLNIGADAIRFGLPNAESSIKVALDPAVNKSYSFSADKKQHQLSASELQDQYPEKWLAMNTMKAAALEIQSCCHPEAGASPSSEDCGRYGINSESVRTNKTDSGDQSSPSQNN